MNTKSILIWGSFIVIVGLIIWGMIAAANKADKENLSLAPVDEVVASDWIKAATTSKVTLIEYSDFQCPACGAYFPLVEELVEKNPTQFAFVYRHFPLNQHQNAIPAARAAEAAGNQGKFWDMHSMLFSTQESWATSTDPKSVFTEYAKKLKLDMTKFSADYDSVETQAAIDADLKSGLKAGINSTPTFYLNGKKINAQNYDQFKKLIDDATAANS